MVYIDSNSVKMTVLKSENTQIDKLELVNQTDKTKYHFVLENVEYTKHTYEIDLENIITELSTTGQYDYYLFNGDTLVQSGIVQFNDYKSEMKAYKFENKIIQYGE